MNLNQQTLLSVRDDLRSGKTTATAVCQSCLDRIQATENTSQPLGALLNTQAEAALERARSLDAAGPDPSKPLWGVPLTVKDALCTKGITTTAGSRILEHFVPPYSATVVERLEAAGAIILGKNNMDEFAMGSSNENSAFFPCHNPWDFPRVPGGSSGGSAASVAACQCFGSLGSDTGGSIRQPASLCGCVGLKPTYGAVSRYGLLAYASSFDQVGPLARTLEDAALLYSVIAGHDPKDSTSSRLSAPPASFPIRQDLKGVRIGIPREYYPKDDGVMDNNVLALCQETLETLRSLGADLVEFSMPHTIYATAAYYVLATAEASSNLARYDGVRYTRRAPNVKDIDELYTLSRTQGFGEEVQRRMLLGAFVLSAGYYDAYYKKAAQVRRLVQEDFTRALNQYDAILTPVSPVTAWPLGFIQEPLRMYFMDIFTLPLNLSGLPGLAFPVGLAASSNGGPAKLPVAMQLVGKPFEENTLFGLAKPLVEARGTANLCGEAKL